MKVGRFIDSVSVYPSGGRGGNGCVSFRREKFVPRGGPDGGDGGNGGSVFVEADKNLWSLISLFHTPHPKAEDGTHGKGKKLYGKTGSDLVVKVPCGTEVYDEETDLLLGDLVQHGDNLLVAQGGKGGLGNCHWVTSSHRAPREHTPGEDGEKKTLRLVYKTVADVGMIGFPNAGKSLLVSKISQAHPRVAAYPFTTLCPAVGTVEFEDYRTLTVADVPGLIDGAHSGVGLGHEFLRHIERALALMFVIDMAGVDGRDPVDDYAKLRNELELHDSGLTGRPSIVVANKMDLPAADGNLKDFRKRTGTRPIKVSALEGDGIDKLRKALDKFAGNVPR